MDRHRKVYRANVHTGIYSVEDAECTGACCQLCSVSMICFSMGREEKSDILPPEERHALQIHVPLSTDPSPSHHTHKGIRRPTMVVLPRKPERWLTWNCSGEARSHWDWLLKVGVQELCPSNDGLKLGHEAVNWSVPFSRPT